MQEAWRQVGDVLEANRLRRRGEYSLGATRRLYDRWLTQMDAGALLTSTSPVHAKVLVAPGETVVGRLRDSPLPPAVVSVELRRFARARGALAHATSWQDGVGVQAVTGALRPARSPAPAGARWTRWRHSTRRAGCGARPSTKEVLGRLVDEDVSALTPAEAATRLDAVSTLETFTLPTREEVTAHVDRRPGRRERRDVGHRAAADGHPDAGRDAGAARTATPSAAPGPGLAAARSRPRGVPCPEPGRGALLAERCSYAAATPSSSPSSRAATCSTRSARSPTWSPTWATTSSSTPCASTSRRARARAR